MPVYGDEKIVGDVAASGSAAEFAVSGRLRCERVAVGGQKRVCLAPHGVCEEQGTGEPTVGSQD